MNISYLEDKNIIAPAIERRDYSIINDIIDNSKETLDYYIEENVKLVGYKIYEVKQLTEIYGFNVKAISFYMRNIVHEFNENDDKLFERLIGKLNENIYNDKAYYIIKCPSHCPTLINQLNKHLNKVIFTGGTICYYTNKCSNKNFKEDGLQLVFLTEDMKEKYREQLIDLGEKSFEEYFGQYHISYVTREKAPMIYKNWIKDYVENNYKDIIIAKYKDKICGFLTLSENEYCGEIVLNAVDLNHRGSKVYERMLRYAVASLLERNKMPTISTQFDNFLVQRAWVNVGFKPYYSYYLMHIDNR